MARRPTRFLVFVVACGVVLPGCAQWGSWFSSGKSASSAPSNQVQPANQGYQFGAKKPSALQALVGKGKSAEPPAPAAKPRTPEEIKASQMAMARLCERRGEYDQAEAIYHALIKKYPQEATPHHRLGVLAVQKGKFSEAEEHFRTAQAMAPPSADLLSDLGYTYYLEHRLPEAEAALRQALARDPQHAAATNNLALVVGAQGRFDESLALFRRGGSEAQALANLAFVFSQYGDLPRAEEAYLRALSLDNTMRPAAHAVLQVAERRRVQEQLAARQSAPQEERPADAAERPAAPEDPPLATVVDGRPVPSAVRRTASAAASESRPVAPTPPLATVVDGRPVPSAVRRTASATASERRPVAPTPSRPAPVAEELAAADQPLRMETSRPPLSAASDPVEPDVAEVEVSEPIRRRDGLSIRPLPLVRVATDERDQSVQKTSFESAMAELEAALARPRPEGAARQPASAAAESLR